MLAIFKPLRTLIAALAAMGLLLGGCSSSTENEKKSESPDDTARVGMIGVDSTDEPVKGGTLTFAAYSEVGELDPATAIASGSTGGTELVAVYDLLMRWDSESKELVPQLAKSLEPKDDHQTWDLKLRENVHFSDGTTLDAKAVKWSIERYLQGTPGDGALWSDNVKSIEVVDDLTVRFGLTEPWPQFGLLLSKAGGMIVGKASDQNAAKFTPVGAGPFKLERYAEAEEMVLAANPDYWNGAPYLDKLRIVYLNDPHAIFDSLETGGIQAAFIQDKAVVDEALDKGYHGYLEVVPFGSIAVINAAPGRPGEDVRVRKAMFQAINPKIVNERAYAGAGPWGSSAFPETSTWSSDVAPLPYDPDAAKKLLDEAKADGFDGKITYTGRTDPAARATALAVKSMLEAVGFSVELNLLRTVSEQVNLIRVDHDYDVAGWGMSLREADPYSRMVAYLHSDGNLKTGVAMTDERDAIIDDFKAATSDDERREVLKRFQEQLNEDVPVLVYGPNTEYIAWPKNIQGVKSTDTSIVLFDKAWIQPKS